MGDKTVLDFQQLEQICKKFQQEADDLQGLYQDTKNRVDNLHSIGWVGRGSDKFFEESENMVLPAMSRLINAMRNASNILNNIMNLYQQAQEEASNPFRSLRI